MNEGEADEPANAPKPSRGRKRWPPRITVRCPRPSCRWKGRRRPDIAVGTCPKCKKTLTVVGTEPKPKLIRITVHCIEADLRALGPRPKWRTKIREAVTEAAATKRDEKRHAAVSKG